MKWIPLLSYFALRTLIRYQSAISRRQWAHYAGTSGLIIFALTATLSGITAKGNRSQSFPSEPQTSQRWTAKFLILLWSFIRYFRPTVRQHNNPGDGVVRLSYLGFILQEFNRILQVFGRDRTIEHGCLQALVAKHWLYRPRVVVIRIKLRFAREK